MADTYQINGHMIDVSNTGKIFFPDAGITKGDLITYYTRIADHLLLHAGNRLLMMERYPDGINDEGFYQKKAGDHFPDWIPRHSVELVNGGSREEVVCRDAATLVYLADQGCITPHIWLSRIDMIDYPDKIIFDLDPSETGFEQVREAAYLLGDYLKAEALNPYVMTTGSRGLHVVVPILRENTFDRVRTFARDIADELADQYPEKLTTEVRKNKREGRIFLDYLRNAYGQTSVAPYAIRAKPGAPVATPLRWKDLENSSLRSNSYTLHNIFRRLGRIDDPWSSFFSSPASLGLDEDKG